MLLTQGGSEQVLSNNIIEKKFEIKIYPTWVENFINIETDSQLIEVNIFDISGKLMVNSKEKKMIFQIYKLGYML